MCDTLAHYLLRMWNYKIWTPSLSIYLLSHLPNPPLSVSLLHKVKLHWYSRSPPFYTTARLLFSDLDTFGSQSLENTSRKKVKATVLPTIALLLGLPDLTSAKCNFICFVWVYGCLQWAEPPSRVPSKAALPPLSFPSWFLVWVLCFHPRAPCLQCAFFGLLT